MKAKKTIFIIPGFRHKPTNKAYKEIAKILKQEGYNPIPIKLPWRQTTISQNTDYFLKQYKQKLSKQKGKQNIYLLGFSFGAMIAFIAATKVKVKGLVLCSLSPFFKEDIAKKIKSLQDKDSLQLSCAALAKKIKAKKILMLYGEKETKPLIARVTTAYKQIPSENKYLFSIQKTDHDIGDKKYLYAIQQITKTFL